MSLETKGTIKWDPDVKPSEPQYMIEAKQLGICVEGSGNLEQMMDELTERIRRGISEEFGIPRCDVQMVKYSATLTFDVSRPINRTLEDYEKDFTDRPDVIALERKIQAYAERTGQDPQAIYQKLIDEGIAEGQIAGAVVLQAAADKVNSGALDGKGYTVTASLGGEKPPAKKKKGKEAPE
jgi:hypothetical protein